MNNIIDKVAWIVIKDRKVLMTRSKGKEKYYIPGGKREIGGSDEACLVREIKEELSVNIIRDSISYFGTFQAQAHGQAEGVNVKMSCYLADYEGTLAQNNEIETFEWCSFRDKLKGSFVDHIIFDDLKNKSLIE